MASEPAAPLEQLLLDCSDLAQQILALVPLNTLGVLACVSSSTRAVLDALPEAIWQVSSVFILARCQSTV